MIEVIAIRVKKKGNKETLKGYIDNQKYFDTRNKLCGYIEGNAYKLPDGYTVLTLTEEGVILNEENESIGFHKGELFDWSEMYEGNSLAKYCKRSYSKTSGEIYHAKGDLILILRGEISNLTDLDYFGILASFTDLGA